MWKTFKHWFVNSFWYHYKWHVAVVLLVALTVVFVVNEISGRVRYDLSYVVAVEARAYEPQAAEISEIAGETVGDQNGDGQIYVYGAVLSLDDSNEEGVYNNQRLATIFVDDAYLLYFIDELTAERIGQWEEFFRPWSDFGIETGSEDPYLLRVDTWPVFQRAGLTDGPLYAGIKNSKEEDRQGAEAAAALIRALREHA